MQRLVNKNAREKLYQHVNCTEFSATCCHATPCYARCVKLTSPTVCQDAVWCVHGVTVLSMAEPRCQSYLFFPRFVQCLLSRALSLSVCVAAWALLANPTSYRDCRGVAPQDATRLLDDDCLQRISARCLLGLVHAERSSCLANQ